MKDSPSDEPRLHYQPIVLLESGEVISAEALLFEESAETVATEAEKSGNGLRIFGAYMYGRGLAQLNEWFEAHHGAFDYFATAELSGFRNVTFFEQRRHVFKFGARGCHLVRQVLSASE